MSAIDRYTFTVAAGRRLARALAVGALLALGACGDDAPPEKRPDDLTVRYVWNLAPAEVEGSLEIESASARYRERRGESMVRFRFKPSPAQLDALWAVLRAQRVDTLETEKAGTSRKGHETLTVRWGDRGAEIRDGAGRQVAAEGRERWRRIQLALRDLILAERNKRGLPEH